MIKKMSNNNVCIKEKGFIKRIRLKSANSEEISQILSYYPMPTDFITSGLDRNERPRTETYVNEKGKELKLFVFLYPVEDLSKNDMDSYYTEPVSIVIGPDFIITTSLGEESVIDKIFSEADDRLSDMKEKYGKFSWMMNVFWKISEMYIAFLEDIYNKIKELENRAIKSSDNKILYELVGINKGLIQFENSLEGNSEILDVIEKNIQNDNLEESADGLLRDVKVEHNQALSLVKEYRDEISILDDMLSNVISNNMNQIMKKLTAWTIVLAIPATISTLWGMKEVFNFAGDKYGFVILLFIMLIIGFFVYLLITRDR